jgi:hypothetical protein
MKKVPKYIFYLIKKKEWRELIYELIEIYNNSYLLNYIMEKISQTEHVFEIISIKSYNSINFKVFHNILIGTY